MSILFFIYPFASFVCLSEQTAILRGLEKVNHNSYFFQLLFVKFIAVSQIQYRERFGSDINDLKVRRDSSVKLKSFF